MQCTRCLLGVCTIFKPAPIRLLLSVLTIGMSNALMGAELPMLEFSMKPRLCVLTGDEEACYDELQIRWRAQQKMNLCLYRSDFEKPLHCWLGQMEGEHRFVLTTSENVTFSLKESERGLEVSEAFEVIHDSKRYRRPRRNPWSFF